MREGAEIIIATPGRLKDVIERHVIVLSQCTYIVMDEADRMVNLGFEADLTFILDKLPSDTLKGEDEGMMMDVDGELVKKGRTRVTTLFSATMPPAVERLTRKYLKKPAIVTIGEAGRAVDTVEQRVEFVIGEEKRKCVIRPFRQARIQADMFMKKSDCVLSIFSIMMAIPRPLSCLSIRRRRLIWFARMFKELGYVNDHIYFYRLLFLLLALLILII